jgi:hypothetical protein
MPSLAIAALAALRPHLRAAVLVRGVARGACSDESAAFVFRLLTHLGREGLPVPRSRRCWQAQAGCRSGALDMDE